VELAAVLLSFLVLLVLGLALACGAWVLRSVRGRPARWLLPLAGGLSVAVWGWLLLQARGGLVQLNPWLVAPPVAFLLAFGLADRSARVRGLAPRVVAAAGLVLLASWGGLLMSDARATGALVANGAWSPPLVSALRALSDFDRDGYSGWLAGGDCAPFDVAIHPGAREVPGDGLDNNCIAGDGGEGWQPRRPSWGSRAHGEISNMNVVVVTIETLRHDHASFVSAARDTTPELRALAKESLVFERMYSSAPHTRLAIASLFSSLSPSQIEWLPQAREKKMRRIGPRTPWLPELLSARGYETIAVLSNFAAFTGEEDAGFERGFRHYDTSTPLHYRGGTMWGFPAAQQIDKAIGYLQRAKRPLLLWLHLFEPHYRYEQPPGAPVFGQDEQARYDAEIWHVDRELGRLLRALREQGLWDNTLLLVAGDHGEAFGEHDDRWHGTNLHDPQLRPAALLRIPGVVGKRIREAVTFTDIAPTLARVLGDRDTFDKLQGRSLTPFLHRGKLPEGSNGFIAESFSVDDGRLYQAAFVDYPLKLIYVEEGQRFSLFDLERDPGERRPLDPLADPRGAPLYRALVGYLERVRLGSRARENEH
jgi:arylsulfatase A-like enzyme